MVIRNVAIAGATGNVGSAIVEALVSSDKFNVTVLSRKNGTSALSFAESVNSVLVDYSNPGSLLEALKGQDAVISALNPRVIDHQRALLDASVIAGVQRFIPSEFGSDSLNPKAARLPVFAPKKSQEEHIRALAVQGKISYTVIMNGPFLDWGMNNGFFGLDLRKKQLSYLDGGGQRFSTSTLATVGKAVVGVLEHPEETKNRAVYVQDTAVSLRHLGGLAKQALGDDGWTEVDAGTAEVTERTSWDRLKAGQTDMGVFLGFLLAAIFREGYGGHFRELDNDLLHIQQLTDSEIIEIIKRVALARSA